MSPICRAYFGKDGKINSEGRHFLAGQKEDAQGAKDKNYVRCMREVAQEMQVPFLDMTARSCELYEQCGQDYCMANYFNCGDKTHTSAAGGRAIASLAYELLINSAELAELHPWMLFPTLESYNAYAQRIEDAGKKAAFAAKGKPFSETLAVISLQNIEQTKNGYIAAGGAWPAGEIDEVANRYIEYTIAAEKKKGLVIETITLPVRAKGSAGMNLHINYGFGEAFSGVSTIYENTALPKNKWLTIQLDQPILVPAGQELRIRVLPWHDSNGRPQSKRYLQLGELKITGKRLQ
jgi:hypothetical protein